MLRVMYFQDESTKIKMKGHCLRKDFHLYTYSFKKKKKVRAVSPYFRQDTTGEYGQTLLVDC